MKKEKTKEGEVKTESNSDVNEKLISYPDLKRKDKSNNKKKVKSKS